MTSENPQKMDVDFDDDSNESPELLQDDEHDMEHDSESGAASSRKLKTPEKENETENLEVSNEKECHQDRTEGTSQSVPPDATGVRPESSIDVDSQEPDQPLQGSAIQNDSGDNTEEYHLNGEKSNLVVMGKTASKKSKTSHESKGKTMQTRINEYFSRDSSPDQPKAAKPPRDSSPAEQKAAKPPRDSSPDEQKAAKPPRDSSPDEQKAAKPPRDSSPAEQKAAKPPRDSSPDEPNAARPPRDSSPDEQKAARRPRMKKRWSDLDTEAYRNGYPGKKDDPKAKDNLKFYTNKLKSKPDGDFIDDIHKNWKGNYKLLETHHGYIQWLFPIREPGMNYQAQELQLHEAKAIKKDKDARERVLKSYELMLDFYGMSLKDRDTGEIERAENCKERFAHLNRSRHNHLRITRILKSLGELGYDHFQYPFVEFVLREALVKKTLKECIDSCFNYWIGTVKNDQEREKLEEFFNENSKESDTSGYSCTV